MLLKRERLGLGGSAISTAECFLKDNKGMVTNSVENVTSLRHDVMPHTATMKHNDVMTQFRNAAASRFTSFR